MQGQKDVESHALVHAFLDKTRVVRSLYTTWYVLPIVLAAGSAIAYITLRYAEPIYQSEALLRVTHQTETHTLNIQNFFNNLAYKNSNVDIGLLHSSLFFNKVGSRLNYPVSYYKQGNILQGELYGSSPFRVHLKDSLCTEETRSFALMILDSLRFQISMNEERWEERLFGDTISLADCNLQIQKTQFFVPKGKYMFYIHGKGYMAKYLNQAMDARFTNVSPPTIEMTLQDANPWKARDFLLIISQTYIEMLFEMQHGMLTRSLEFIEDQLRTIAGSIGRRDDYFERIIVQEKTTNLNRALGDAINDLQDASQRIKLLEDQLNSLDTLSHQSTRDQLLTPNYNYPLPEGLEASIDAFNEVSKENNVSKLSYKSGSYVLTRHQQRFQLIRQELNRHMIAYRTSLKHSLNEALRERATMEEKLLRLPGVHSEYQKNNRLYKLEEQFYLSLIRKKVELEVALASSTEQAVLLSSPQLPKVPVSPNPVLYYAGGIGGGVMVYFTVFIVFFLRNGFVQKTESLKQLEKVPLLGVVPHVAQLNLRAGKEIVQIFRKRLLSIKASLDFFVLGQHKKVIMVSSIVAGEGRTLFAIHLADLFAGDKRRVLLIDLHFQAPNTCFKSPPHQGLSALLNGGVSMKELIRRSSRLRFAYLPLGLSPPEPVQLVAAKRFKELLSTCRQHFDLIFVDTAPVTSYYQTHVIMAHQVDYILCLLRANVLRLEQIAKWKSFLHTINKENSVGGVLNGQLPQYYKSDGHREGASW